MRRAVRPLLSWPPAEAIGSAAAAQASGENFPVALRLLPGRYRRHLEAVYGFARAVDDMGDEAPPEDRLRLLDELEADLGRLYRVLDPALRDVPRLPPGGRRSAGPDGGGGGPRIGVVRALAPVVGGVRVPQQAFADLIRANRQDQVVTRYATAADLVGYCELSANPVGRIVLHVFGAATPERMILSDRVCTALQLAEHWQDVAEDFRAGRIYLPAEDMERFGCTEGDLAAATAGAAAPGADGVRGGAGPAAARRRRPAGREFARVCPGCRGRLRGRRPGRPGRDHRGWT